MLNLEQVEGWCFPARRGIYQYIKVAVLARVAARAS